MAVLNKKEIEMQSIAAYTQSCELWRKHARIARELGTKPLSDLNGIGIGKTLVCAATGHSLEKNMDLLKKHRSKYDIFCCDKSFGLLIDKGGIIPDYVLIADARVSYEKYMEPWKNKTENVKLIANVCANVEWVKNWEGEVYQFVNKDAINSEKEFQALSGLGDENTIPAASNVSNCMIVLPTQCDEYGAKNKWCYDKYILVGYDYSWGVNSPYYAYDHKAGNKRYWMNHMLKIDMNGNDCYTSQNLFFSARWLYTYANMFDLPVFNASGEGIFQYNCVDLKEELEKLQVSQKRINDMVKLWKEEAKLTKRLKAARFEFHQLYNAA